MPFSVLLPSFLTGMLRRLGPLVSPRAAARFLRSAGREREVFLPFVYRWFDERERVQDHALRYLRGFVLREGIVPPRVFHGPFTGRAWVPFRWYLRNLADPRRQSDHARALQRECRFLGRVRQEFGIRQRLLYILHLGRRGRQSPSEALAVAVETIRPSVETAAEAGVVLSLENVADRSADHIPVGARLSEVGEALARLGDAGRPEAPIGLTFDVSHALLAYRGDAAAIAEELKALLPTIVNLHINAPRFYPSEQPWADRHEAPTAGFPPLWELFRAALAAPRLREFRAITYEVNWAAPLLNPIVGGSPLPAVIRGYELVRANAAEALAALDEEVALPYAGAVVRPQVLSAPVAAPVSGT